jgi:hypothetical protein
LPRQGEGDGRPQGDARQRPDCDGYLVPAERAAHQSLETRLKAASQPLTINADANTHYVKGDQAATLDALAQNDQVVVKTKMSRCDLLANASSPVALTAKEVVDQTTGG